MSNANNPNRSSKTDTGKDHETAGEPKRDSPTSYQIRLQGHLGRHWAVWFEGMTITLEENGDTLLTGEVFDQAALYGLLSRVRDVGIPLISVIRLQPAPPIEGDESS